MKKYSYTAEELQQMEKAIEGKARLELEMEQEIAAVEAKVRQEAAQQSQTDGKNWRSEVVTPAERGGQLLDQMMTTHQRNLEK